MSLDTWKREFSGAHIFLGLRLDALKKHGLHWERNHVEEDGDVGKRLFLFPFVADLIADSVLARAWEALYAGDPEPIIILKCGGVKGDDVNGQ